MNSGYEKKLVISLRSEEQSEDIVERAKQVTTSYNENRLRIAQLLMRGLRFVNKQGQPLHMMTPLRLDPALLEQTLYH